MFRPACRALSVLLLAAGLLAQAEPASAATITFTGAYGALTPTNDGIFSYVLHTGSLSRTTAGNGDLFGLQSNVCDACTEVTTLRVTRNDIPGGYFRFDGADVRATFGFQAGLTFRGIDTGQLYSADAATPIGGAWSTYDMPVQIDITTLEIQFVSIGTQIMGLDNLRLTAVGPIGTPPGDDVPAVVPEPGTMALMGLGLGILAVRRLRKASAG